MILVILNRVALFIMFVLWLSVVRTCAMVLLNP
jgi:hypothetical protein